MRKRKSPFLDASGNMNSSMVSSNTLPPADNAHLYLYKIRKRGTAKILGSRVNDGEQDSLKVIREIRRIRPGVHSIVGRFDEEKQNLSNQSPIL